MSLVMLAIRTSASDCLETLVSEMIHYA